MDPAQVIEAKGLLHHEPMNKVIDFGDSDVQQYYKDTTVFVTGGSGFLGKQLVEKLFRSCAIKKMYLLLRSKKGKTMQERLDYTLKDPVFDLVRKKKPGFADQIEALEGDVADSRLGLTDSLWNKLTQEVDVVFHEAATVRFDEPLRVATLTNTRGTRDIITLARECPKLKSFVYVSTAYTYATKDRVGKEVLEQFYPSPIPPDILIRMAEEVDEQRLNSITNDLIEGWPNTYTFTKAVAEELIRTTASDLPVCIVRPPIVTPAYYEPSPGWMDMSAVAGCSGVLLGIVLAVLHVFRIDRYMKLPMTPVDYVTNATIAAGWDAAERRKNDAKIPIYIVTNEDNYSYWDFFHLTLEKEAGNLCSPKALWVCSLFETKNKYMYWCLALLMHYIPAYILDVVCTIIGKRPKEIKSFVGLYKRVEKMQDSYEYFMIHTWKYKNDNVQEMIRRMSDRDRAIYNCDLSSVDWVEYVKIWVVGIRKYIIKDGLQGTVAAHEKQTLYRIANYVLISTFIIVLWYTISLLVYILRYVIGL